MIVFNSYKTLGGRRYNVKQYIGEETQRAQVTQRVAGKVFCEPRWPEAAAML